MNGPKLSFKTFISFLFLRWKFSEERKSFLHSREFFQAIAENNVQFGLAVSLIVFSIGLAGLMGCSYNPGIPELIPEIPSRLVYTLMILLNIPQILFADSLCGGRVGAEQGIGSLKDIKCELPESAHQCIHGRICCVQYPEGEQSFF